MGRIGNAASHAIILQQKIARATTAMLNFVTIVMLAYALENKTKSSPAEFQWTHSY